MTDYIGVGCLNCLGVWDWDKHIPPDRKCPSCVKPETLIAGGYKHIAELEIGDRVFGASTTRNFVKRTFVRQFSGEMLRIAAVGIFPLEVTPEHPVLVRTSKRIGDDFLFSGYVWKPAKELVAQARGNGDYLVIPRLRASTNLSKLDLHNYTTKRGLAIAKGKGVPTTFPIDEDTAWLLGLYVAEGDSSKKEVAFNLGKHEIAIQDRVFRIARRLGYSPCKVEKPTTTRVCISSRILARAFRSMCGAGATNKRVPDFLLLHRRTNLLKAFLQGYIEGDGGFVSDRHTKLKNITRMSTVSKPLITQLQLLYARLGLVLCTYTKHGARQGLIQGRKVSEHEAYYATLGGPAREKFHIKVLDDALLTPVRAIERIRYNGPVYNIATDDKTFLVSNVVVHNCGIATAEVESSGGVRHRDEPWSRGAQ